MNDTKNSKTSPGAHDHKESDMNQANPGNSDKQRGTPVRHQGDDPAEAAPQQRQPNRDAQPNQSKNNKF